MGMTDVESRQVALNYYINLLRIKAHEKGENAELDFQLQIAKVGLAPYSIDTAALERSILGK